MAKKIKLGSEGPGMLTEDLVYIVKLGQGQHRLIILPYFVLSTSFSIIQLPTSKTQQPNAKYRQNKIQSCWPVGSS